MGWKLVLERHYREFPKIRGPKYSTLNSRILIIRTPNKVPLIFGSSHQRVEAVGFGVVMGLLQGSAIFV